MKKYSVIVTLIALGLLGYIVLGGKSSSQPQTTKSASVYQVTATVRPTARPTDQPTARPTSKPTSSPVRTITRASTPTQRPATQTYILNKNTKVFHKPSCASVKQMKESNRRTFTGTRQEVISQGYRSCGRCNP